MKNQTGVAKAARWRTDKGQYRGYRSRVVLAQLRMGDKRMDKIKKILNSKCIPNWVLFSFVIILAIFAASGWKIIYGPQLENDWSAIDAIGGWASAVISGVAIWFAVSAPKHIARRQNDIALFEMRFSSYNIYLKKFEYRCSLDTLTAETVNNMITSDEIDDFRKIFLASMADTHEQNNFTIKIWSIKTVFEDRCKRLFPSNASDAFTEICGALKI